MYEVKEWKHLFKLDPDKEIDDEALQLLCESGTDAIMVGGTDHVTLDNVIALLSRIRRFNVPCVLEISNIESITPGFDFYFIPTILNSNSTEWIVDLHHKAVKEYGELINWEEIYVEGYCILNEDSKVANLTKAKKPLQIDDVVAYARMTEHMFKLPIFYIEYSGTYGDVEVVKQVKDVLKNTQLFYGGGIQTLDQAIEMKTYADTIIIGNSIYENFNEALQTVKAIKQK